MKITLLSLLWHLIPFMTLHGKLVEKATVSFCPVKPTSENIGSSPGEPGKRGIKGEKGELGDSKEANATTEEFNNMKEIMQELQKDFSNLFENSGLLHQQIQSPQNNITSALYSGYMDLSDGWFSLFNGYIYKITPTNTWQNCRSFCQSLDADLVVHGVRDAQTRRIIHRKAGGYYWVGLSDRVTEGDWRWVNGETDNDDVRLWHPHQPDDYANNQDCGYFVLWGNPPMRIDDAACHVSFRAICEKRI